jgi:hypothetical protein
MVGQWVGFRFKYTVFHLRAEACGKATREPILQLGKYPDTEPIQIIPSYVFPVPRVLHQKSEVFPVYEVVPKRYLRYEFVQ